MEIKLYISIFHCNDEYGIDGAKNMNNGPIGKRGDLQVHEN